MHAHHGIYFVYPNLIMTIKLIYLLLFIFSTQGVLASLIFNRATYIENELNAALQQPQNTEAILKNLDKTINTWSAKEFSLIDLIQNADKSLALLFNIKSKLRAIPIADLAQKYPTQQIEQSLRKTLNSIRYLEDYISESVFSKKSLQAKILLPFEGQLGFNQNKDNGYFSIDSLQSGDVILVRGNSVMSSSIARISKSPSLNSHLAIVYKDEVTKEKFLIESMSHSGVIVTELNKAFSTPLARATVYRPYNQEAGKSAAQFAMNQVRASEAAGKILKFDFSLDMTYNCRFFCSKFVSWVYEKSSDGQIIMPQHQSYLNRPNNSFKEGIGVKPQISYSFLPSDIDLDSRFELVNEYRNPEMTPGVRIDDFITDKVFEWIDKENLDFKPDLRLKLFSKILVKIAQNNFLHGLLKKAGTNLNPDTTAELISTMAIMKFTIDKIKSELLNEFESYYKTYGKNMSPRQVYDLIEVYKKENPKLLKHFQKKSISLSNSCLVYYSSR
jgi:hypothetical protein